MQVKLKVETLSDTALERKFRFSVIAADGTEAALFTTTGAQVRRGAFNWNNDGVFRARSRVASWIRKNSAILV